MRGAQAQNWSAGDVAESYALWWREAGLHTAASNDTHSWLAEPAADEEPSAPAAPLPRQRVADFAPVTPIRPASAGTMPGDLPGFLAWLAQDSAQPDAAWGGAVFLPSGTAQARLLVITDMPDDGAAEIPLAGTGARLVAAMLGAIGLPLSDVAFAPLATRRAPGGLLDEPTATALAGRLRHYLGLARPRAALVLGDRTSRALIGAAGASGPANLPELNLAGGTMPVAALPAPELLMRRPLAKAASWQTLRLLHGAIAR